MERRQTVTIALALVATYLIWGSTYYAMRVAIHGYPPLLMASLRFGLAGVLMVGFLKLRGSPWPSRAEWGGAAVTGLLMPAIGNGAVAVAEQWVASSLAAVLIAAMPLFAALFAGVFGRWPTRWEWVGLALGTTGVLFLNLEGDLRASPLGAALLLLAPASWALGSVLVSKLPHPKGAMSSGAQMLCGSMFLGVASLIHRDRFPASPGMEATLAVAYLVVFGSIVAYSAYGYLLRTVRPTLATSYAYVNPVVALSIGMLLGGERVGVPGLIGMGLIVGGVAVLSFFRAAAPSKSSAKASPPPPRR